LLGGNRFVVLRVHFDTEDLARTRIAANIDQLWEIVLSMHVLQSRAPNLVFEPWWRDVHARPGLRGTVTLLNSVNPPGSPYFPDFLTPFDEYGDLGSGIETVLRTPVRRLRNELVLLAEHRKLPTWVGALAEGRATALNRLGGWLREYHEQAIGPYEASIGRALAAHRAACARTLVTGGWDAVFAGLAPSMRWAAPVLEVDYPVDRDLVLAGRGLLLVPSFFCWRTPVMLADPELPPVLVYPIPHAPPWLGNPDPSGERAVPAALLGVTRTAVLEALDRESTTLELARRVGVAPATISHHTGVLREAGLILTTRVANLALHSLTDLGRALLDGGP